MLKEVFFSNRIFQQLFDNRTISQDKFSQKNNQKILNNMFMAFA